MCLFSLLSLLFFHPSQSETRPSNDPTSSDEDGDFMTILRIKITLDLFLLFLELSDDEDDGVGDDDDEEEEEEGEEDKEEVRIFSYCFSSSVGPV